MTGRLRQGKRILLVVEDDPDTASLLAMYFTAHDFEVIVASRGEEGLDAARKRLPDLILLDIILPDVDGFTVGARLRASPRTSHIPIIILSEKAALQDRVTGLESGAQDYVTKPFDLEELRLRAQNLVARSQRENLVDPRTNLPTGPWIEEQLARARARPGWHVIECQIADYQPFLDQNGFMAGDDVLKFTAHLLREVTDQHGTAEDFLAHRADAVFLILTGAADPAALAEQARRRFDDEVPAYYGFVDREQGYMAVQNHRTGQLAPVPLMSMQVRILDGGTG
jgi:two-component system alkaline phosphatase synthesis response regulator PhoP